MDAVEQKQLELYRGKSTAQLTKLALETQDFLEWLSNQHTHDHATKERLLQVTNEKIRLCRTVIQEQTN